MGCDYYIQKVLYIHFEDDNYLRFTIGTERGYYHSVYDSDDETEDYDRKLIEYKKKCLTPQMKPIIIYENSVFSKPIYNTKYKSMVETFTKDCGKNFSDITKIIKKEERNERN